VHTFTFPEVALGSSSNQQPYFRAMIFFNKKPGLTDEFFHEHWKSVHADLTMHVEGAGVSLVRYSQVSWGDEVWCGVVDMIDEYDSSTKSRSTRTRCSPSSRLAAAPCSSSSGTVLRSSGLRARISLQSS
jgi:hypothetical protein